MQNKQLPPFNRGDEVIDDNAEVGYVLENYIDATWDAAGNLTNWHTRIHFRWDQPSYGLTRVVSEGEISLLTKRVPDAIYCTGCGDEIIPLCHECSGEE